MQAMDRELARTQEEVGQLRQQVIFFNFIALSRNIGILIDSVTVYRSSPAGGRLVIWRGSCNPVRL